MERGEESLIERQGQRERERETADKAFFLNLKNLITNYNTTKQYTNLGDSQNLLLNNYIGTDKLKSRIN